MGITLGPIGPSLGWLMWKLSATMDDCREVLGKSKSTAAQIVWAPDRHSIIKTKPSFPLALPYLSLHSSPGDTPALLAELHSLYRFSAITYHPELEKLTTINAYAEADLPMALENLDRRSDYFIQASDFTKTLLFRFPSCKFVLDVQHAYEVAMDLGQDTVVFTRELAKVMLTNNRLTHLHVSGEVSVPGGKQMENHAQLWRATNAHQIVEAVKAVLSMTPYPLPIILEGDYLYDVIAPLSADHPGKQSFLDSAANNIKMDQDFLRTSICT